MTIIFKRNNSLPKWT